LDPIKISNSAKVSNQSRLTRYEMLSIENEKLKLENAAMSKELKETRLEFNEKVFAFESKINTLQKTIHDSEREYQRNLEILLTETKSKVKENIDEWEVW
jgi:hypothetical protein